MKINKFFTEINITRITSVLLISFFLVGYYISDCAKVINTNSARNNDYSLLTKIIIQNTTFYSLIIIGAFFYNISSIFLISYNSFIWGTSAKISICQIGILKTLSLIGPHISIEIFWILFAIYNSFGLSKQLFLYFNNKIQDKNFIIYLKHKSRSIFIGYILVIFGCIVEFYVSPLIFQIL
jgi:uncharacterized membrane protein SpoIIM required for sporulation